MLTYYVQYLSYLDLVLQKYWNMTDSTSCLAYPGNLGSIILTSIHILVGEHFPATTDIKKSGVLREDTENMCRVVHEHSGKIIQIMFYDIVFAR